ncbi:hypothetical protein I6S72_003964 [Salmonella enterica subsp. enterica serovar Carmel]|nr:hypothetical protein [Salmonella enterica subsp. enterica serovar Carmel]
MMKVSGGLVIMLAGWLLLLWLFCGLMAHDVFFYRRGAYFMLSGVDICGYPLRQICRMIERPFLQANHPLRAVLFNSVGIPDFVVIWSL